MLVLDRKVREGFWINGKIFVKVLAVGRHRVKLGVEAPHEIQIWREELGPRHDASPSAKMDGPGPAAETSRAEGTLRPTRRKAGTPKSVGRAGGRLLG